MWTAKLLVLGVEELFVGVVLAVPRNGRPRSASHPTSHRHGAGPTALNRVFAEERAHRDVLPSGGVRCGWVGVVMR